MNVFYFLLVSCLAVERLQADPWGKDADLANKRCEMTCQHQQQNHQICPSKWALQASLLVKFAEVMISFHQNVISPADGPRSHFIPSSSQYTLDAIRKYGFFRGFCMGCDRLMRENEDPWVYRLTLDGAGTIIKYDPVP